VVLVTTFKVQNSRKETELFIPSLSILREDIGQYNNTLRQKAVQ